MRNILIFTVLIFNVFNSHSFAQDIYAAAQTDFIFSMATMNATNISTSQVVRFSGFLNHETQLHVNFNKKIGYYTGLGIKNIGMINRFGDQDINFKQRAYAISIPLAFKFGRVQKQSFIALGAELNFLFHYKEKFLFKETISKNSEWFSKKVNLLQPAVFFQLKYLKSQIITFKYFLNDFLRYQSGGLNLPDGTNVGNYGHSSHIFYISWGTSLEFKDPDIQEDVQKIRSARLDN